MPKITKDNVDYNHIYEYNNLSFGVPSAENRALNESHINSIYKKMDERLLGHFIVDIDTMRILDGNHRYYAVKKFLDSGKRLTSPLKVIYEQRLEGESISDAIIRLNNGRKNWTTQDFIMSKSNEGDKYAKELISFCNERELLHTTKTDKKTGIVTKTPIMRYGGWFIKGCNCSPMFKKGNYTHTKTELENGAVLYDEIVKIMKSANITKTGTWFGEFVSAWKQVREEQKDVIESLPNGFDSLLPEFSKRLYLTEERLVNQIGPNMRNMESVIMDAVCSMP